MCIYIYNLFAGLRWPCTGQIPPITYCRPRRVLGSKPCLPHRHPWYQAMARRQRFRKADRKMFMSTYRTSTFSGLLFWRELVWTMYCMHLYALLLVSTPEPKQGLLIRSWRDWHMSCRIWGCQGKSWKTSTNWVIWEWLRGLLKELIPFDTPK